LPQLGWVALNPVSNKNRVDGRSSAEMNAGSQLRIAGSTADSVRSPADFHMRATGIIR